MKHHAKAGKSHLLTLIWVALLGLGLIGLYQRLTQGHLPAGYGSYVPWGLWVALYFHGVGIAGGAFAIGAAGFLLDWPGFTDPRALRRVIVLSVACIIPAFLGVLLDLGHMERSFRIFTSPGFTSMMAFNAWMYGIFMVVAAGAWALSYRKDSGWLKPLVCLGALFSVLFPSQSGAFFGVVDAKPYWHSALMPMMFLTSAIAAGAGTLLLVRILDKNAEDAQAAVRRLRQILLIAVSVYFVFEFAEFSIVLWNPTAHAPALELVLFGPYWWVFWIVHIALGGALVLALLATRSPRAWTVGALLVAVCFVSARLNVLVPGQAVGELKGLQEAFQHDRLSYIYHATPMEYLVGFLMVAIGVAVFWAGERISNALSKTTQPSA